jgi:hypothetical protein
LFTSGNGSWFGTRPFTFEYQWTRDGIAIGGETNRTYTSVSADEGKTLRCEVRASNAFGISPFVSSSNSATGVSLPVNTVAPTLSPSGTQGTGTVITLGNGTWTGTSPITFEYRWTRNNVVIAGQTNNTYTIVAGDDGTVIKGQVRAINSVSTSAYVTTSNQVDANNVLNTARTQAFLTATGITDQTIIDALNAMDTSLISAGLLPSGTGAGIITVLYPFVGGTASLHKWNFVNPQYSDAAKRIVWFGGMTHNSNGITGNASNAYGNMFINPSTDFAIDDIGFSYLCSDTGIDGNVIWGIQTGGTDTRLFHFPAFNGANATQTHFNCASSANTATLRQGFHTLQRTSATNQNNYRNGVLGANVSTSSQTQSNGDIFLLAFNSGSSAGTFDSSNLRIFIAHTKLDATQSLNLYNANVSFQTILGRNV